MSLFSGVTLQSKYLVSLSGVSICCHSLVSLSSVTECVLSCIDHVVVIWRTFCGTLGWAKIEKVDCRIYSSASSPQELLSELTIQCLKALGHDVWEPPRKKKGAVQISIRSILFTYSQMSKRQIWPCRIVQICPHVKKYFDASKTAANLSLIVILSCHPIPPQWLDKTHRYERK